MPTEGFTLADAVPELSDGELAEVETVVVLDGELERSELEHAAMNPGYTDTRLVGRWAAGSSWCGLGSVNSMPERGSGRAIEP